MTSLSDVYEGDAGRAASRGQRLAGAGLFLTGAAGLVVAIALATTGLGEALGLGEYGARELGGVLAGLGLLGVVLGSFAVLPARREVRATAGIGASVAVLGVALFQHLYPYSWVESEPLLALAAGGVYFVGAVTTFWCLFVALATFQTRDDPGGTARMEVTEEGTIELVEEARSLPGLGGIGFFGQDPDGEVETQTNRAASDGGAAADDGGPAPAEQREQAASTTTSDRQERRRSPDRSRRGSAATSAGPSEHDLDPEIAEAGPEASHTTDGGTTATGRDPITETATHQGEPDSYCGNCRHFQYVMDGDDIAPYCTFHDEGLDDMEACPAWVENE